MYNNKNSLDMKTNFLFSKKVTLYSLIGFISALVTSCGSYQNSSYYDSDGIYGNTAPEPQNVSSTLNKNYFKSLIENNEVLNDTIKIQNQGYTETTVINVYNDPWDMGFGMGFGYGWGYAGFGWGYPYYGYGWGYPAYGYGYNNNYSYNSSRRGSSYAYGVNGNRNSQNQSYTTGMSNIANARRGDANSATRNNSSFMTRDYSQNNTSRRGTSTNNSSRVQNYSNTRTYTPSSNNYNNTRSSSSNSGGGRSTGGSYGGGSRSTGGSVRR
jgi:hypothetical protein